VLYLEPHVADLNLTCPTRTSRGHLVVEIQDLEWIWSGDFAILQSHERVQMTAYQHLNKTTKQFSNILLDPNCIFVEQSTIYKFFALAKPSIKATNTMIFVLEALSVVLISGVKLGAWWFAFNWLARY
jgi:hypothetical protein